MFFSKPIISAFFSVVVDYANHNDANCTFATGVNVIWNIVANAESYFLRSVVGTINNGFHMYTCRRDNNNFTYTDDNGNQCRSAL
ncbi:hypothetical protein PG989_006803 [Apiospora arundinis]